MPKSLTVLISQKGDRRRKGDIYLNSISYNYLIAILECSSNLVSTNSKFLLQR